MDGLQGEPKMVLHIAFMARDDNILNDLKYLGHQDISQEEYDQLE